jgi:hypothetical protein
MLPLIVSQKFFFWKCRNPAFSCKEAQMNKNCWERIYSLSLDSSMFHNGLRVCTYKFKPKHFGGCYVQLQPVSRRTVKKFILLHLWDAIDLSLNYLVQTVTPTMAVSTASKASRNEANASRMAHPFLHSNLVLTLALSTISAETTQLIRCRTTVRSAPSTCQNTPIFMFSKQFSSGAVASWVGLTYLLAKKAKKEKLSTFKNSTD